MIYIDFNKSEKFYKAKFNYQTKINIFVTISLYVEIHLLANRASQIQIIEEHEHL